MENVAHTFAGLLLANAVVAWRDERGQPSDARFPWLAAVTSAIANNVADGDLVLTGLTGGKLGYLLHHRGHTHTLVVGIALGALVALAVVALSRRAGPLASGDARWLIALGAVGPVVHIGMDAWNVYGVHPFWPVYDAWYYGDAVFIVEPLLWLAAVPSLLAASRRGWSRILLGVVAALACVLPWLQPDFVPLAARIALVGFGAVVAAIVWRARPSRRPWIGLAAFTVVAVTFLVTSAKVGGDVRRELSANFPEETIHDVTLTAAPVNPVCWMGIAVSTDPGGAFVLRRLVTSASPALVSAAACPTRSDQATAPLRPVEAPGSPRLRFEGEVRDTIGRVRSLSSSHCEIAAMLRFARAPFIVERDAGFVVGDLRFDNEEALGFAEIEVPAAARPCPAFVPSWVPPREDVLIEP